MDEKTLNAIVSSVAKEIADADMTLDTALKLSAKVNSWRDSTKGIAVASFFKVK